MHSKIITMGPIQPFQALKVFIVLQHQIEIMILQRLQPIIAFFVKFSVQKLNIAEDFPPPQATWLPLSYKLM